MSRHAFGEIIGNIETLLNEDKLLVDRKGYSLQKWMDYGVVGWDDPLSSYFIHLDNNQDNIPWMIPNGIKSFEHLCETINYIFDVPNGVFDFKNVIEVNYNRRSILNHENKNIIRRMINNLSMINKKFFDFIKSSIWRLYISSAKHNWQTSRNFNLYNPMLEATVYKWGDSWNMVRFNVHYKGYSSEKLAKDAAFNMWLKEKAY